MRIALTGATGLIGSAVLRTLLDHGHEVTALVRSSGSADAVRRAGATPAQGDFTDGSWLREQFAAADAGVHTASPGDASSSEFDETVARAAVDAYAGSGRAYVHTGGAWVRGSGTAIDENTPLDPPELTAWRPGVEQLVTGADGVRGVVIEPGIVYGGAGQGIAGMLARPDEQGTVRLVGDGSQHWTTVRDDEVADLYLRVLQDTAARGHYIAANDAHPTVREIAAATGATPVAETPDESRARLFAPLVDALLLDQVVAPTLRGRVELGWQPTGRSLLAEIEAGTFAG